MSKVVRAKYDAAQHVLRLAEPLEGVENDEDVDVTVDTGTSREPSILDFRGCLTGKNGEEFAALIDEMFPIEK